MKISKFFLATNILAIIFLFSGCVVLRNITGSSLSVLQRVKDYTQSQAFDYEINDCFQRVLAFAKDEMAETEILKINRRKHAILLLVSRPTFESIDMDGKFTPNNADVGIFFTQEGANKTKVEVNSLSSLFAEYTAEKIFAKLNPPQQLQEITEPEE